MMPFILQRVEAGNSIAKPDEAKRATSRHVI